MYDVFCMLLIQRLPLPTDGIQDSNSKLYKKIAEIEFSSSNLNDKTLTNFVAKRGDLVTDIMIGRTFLQLVGHILGGKTQYILK